MYIAAQGRLNPTGFGVGGVGVIADRPFQLLADTLTLFQSGEADYTQIITIRPPDFQTLLRPCIREYLPISYGGL